MVTMIVVWVAACAGVIRDLIERHRKKVAIRWLGVALLLCITGGVVGAFGNLHRSAATSLVILDAISIVLGMVGLGFLVVSVVAKNSS
jgi:hypothetical protein